MKSSPALCVVGVLTLQLCCVVCKCKCACVCVQTCKCSYVQGRRKQKMLGQASSDARVARQLGGSGGMPPQKILDF